MQQQEPALEGGQGQHSTAGVLNLLTIRSTPPPPPSSNMNSPYLMSSLPAGARSPIGAGHVKRTSQVLKRTNKKRPGSSTHRPGMVCPLPLTNNRASPLPALASYPAPPTAAPPHHTPAVDLSLFKPASELYQLELLQGRESGAGCVRSENQPAATGSGVAEQQLLVPFQTTQQEWQQVQQQQQIPLYRQTIPAVPQQEVQPHHLSSPQQQQQEQQQQQQRHQPQEQQNQQQQQQKQQEQQQAEHSPSPPFEHLTSLFGAAANAGRLNPLLTPPPHMPDSGAARPPSPATDLQHEHTNTAHSSPRSPPLTIPYAGGKFCVAPGSNTNACHFCYTLLVCACPPPPLNSKLPPVCLQVWLLSQALLHPVPRGHWTSTAHVALSPKHHVLLERILIFMRRSRATR